MESQKDGSKVSFQVLIEPNYSNVISLEYTVVVSCWSVPMRKIRRYASSFGVGRSSGATRLFLRRHLRSAPSLTAASLLTSSIPRHQYSAP
jgi:hypothetical protein